MRQDAEMLTVAPEARHVERNATKDMRRHRVCRQVRTCPCGAGIRNGKGAPASEGRGTSGRGVLVGEGGGAEAGAAGGRQARLGGVRGQRLRQLRALPLRRRGARPRCTRDARGVGGGVCSGAKRQTSAIAVHRDCERRAEAGDPERKRMSSAQSIHCREAGRVRMALAKGIAD